MLGLTAETVTIQRTSAQVPAHVDPENRKLYLSTGVDLVAGDVASFRGWVRRITELPQTWADGGIVALFEEGAPYFPDLGTITRGGGWSFDENTGNRTPVAGTAIWSGPCHVANDPYAFDRLENVGAQMISTVAFLIQVPLEVIDVRDGDTLNVTTSRDTRLLVRTLVIKSVRAHSDQLFREMLAFDNQADA